MKGMVIWSFALGEEEPNPCNMRLAKSAEVIVGLEDEEVVTVAQWETARAYNLPIVYIVEKHRKDGAYLDSKEVMAQAAPEFQRCGIDEVIVVAHPFIHRYACFKIVRKFGFTPVKRKISRIGFYKNSLQWWTRGPAQCLLYAVLQKLMGRSGR